jgi:hypothetical protein
VWISDSENLVLKDRREIKTVDDTEEYAKLKQYNDYAVKQDGSRSVFFEKLEDLGALL